MRSNFSLFSSHLDLAHTYWKRIIISGDIAIDATCGRGHDSLLLASLPLSTLHLFDVQEAAIKETTEKLKGCTPLIIPHTMCHSKIHVLIPPNSVKLIVYNLGYLPGSDKTIKTHAQTTLESLISSLDLIKNSGAISITCYPGHPEGAEEEAVLLSFSQTLDPKIWSVCHHRYVNRELAPSLLLFQKCVPMN